MTLFVIRPSGTPYVRTKSFKTKEEAILAMHQEVSEHLLNRYEVVEKNSDHDYTILKKEEYEMTIKVTDSQLV